MIYHDNVLPRDDCYRVFVDFVSLRPPLMALRDMGLIFFLVSFVSLSFTLAFLGSGNGYRVLVVLWGWCGSASGQVMGKMGK